MRYNGEYIVIDGSKLEKIKIDKFFWYKYSEEEYRKFVEDSQEFFEKYQKGEDCTGYMIGESNALYVWEDMANCITVGKTKKGYGIAANGRHRAYIARKYKLKLLVCVGNF